MVDVASVVIASVGAATGLLGLYVAIRANGHAKAANGLAEAARDEAHRANEISLAANDLSRESNTISVGAKDLAEEANAISRHAQALEYERHEVTWKGRWLNPGQWVYTNDGEHGAIDVFAAITVGEEKAEQQVDLLPPGGEILLDLPGAAEAVVIGEALVRTRFNFARRMGSMAPVDNESPFQMPIAQRITWTTPLGRPREHRTSYTGDLRPAPPERDYSWLVRRYPDSTAGQ